LDGDYFFNAGMSYDKFAIAMPDANLSLHDFDNLECQLYMPCIDLTLHVNAGTSGAIDDGGFIEYLCERL